MEQRAVVDASASSRCDFEVVDGSMIAYLFLILQLAKASVMSVSHLLMAYSHVE